MWENGRRGGRRHYYSWDLSIYLTQHGARSCDAVLSSILSTFRPDVYLAKCPALVSHIWMINESQQTCHVTGLSDSGRSSCLFFLFLVFLGLKPLSQVLEDFNGAL